MTTPGPKRYLQEYSVPLGSGTVEFLLDEGAEILDVGLKYDPRYLEDAVVFWVYCTDFAPTSPRRFVVIGTDWVVPDGAYHWGTAQRDHATWHLLEVPAS